MTNGNYCMVVTMYKHSRTGSTSHKENQDDISIIKKLSKNNSKNLFIHLQIDIKVFRLTLFVHVYFNTLVKPASPTLVPVGSIDLTTPFVFTLSLFEFIRSGRFIKNKKYLMKKKYCKSMAYVVHCC